MATWLGSFRPSTTEYMPNTFHAGRCAVFLFNQRILFVLRSLHIYGLLTCRLWAWRIQYDDMILIFLKYNVLSSCSGLCAQSLYVS